MAEFGHSVGWNYTVILPLYVVSTAQHCCRPIKKSILMDYAPKGERGRWNSLDSVTRFGWSGSAVLGGYLIHKYHYGATFLITAGLQALAGLLYLVIVPVVEWESVMEQTVQRSNADLAEPLLVEGRNSVDREGDDVIAIHAHRSPVSSKENFRDDNIQEILACPSIMRTESVDTNSMTLGRLSQSSSYGEKPSAVPDIARTTTA